MNDSTSDSYLLSTLTTELTQFKENLFKHIHNNHTNNIENFVNNEIDSVLYRMKYEFQCVEMTVPNSSENNVALEKAKCIIKMQNLTDALASHIKNANNN